MKRILYFSVVNVLTLASFLVTSEPASAQPTHQLELTESQFQSLLKADSSLTNGFQSPRAGATIRVVKAVSGGVLLEYRTGTNTGTISVVGPSSDMTKRWFGEIVDVVIERTNESKSGKGGKGGGSGKGGSGKGGGIIFPIGPYKCEVKTMFCTVFGA
jgi:uncharacterized membrane protein YgcG